VVALALTGSCGDWLADLANQLGWTLIETDQRPLGIRRFGIEVENVLHAGDVFAVDLRSAPQVVQPAR
jgi:hypothetical protein